jgi:acyl carrier protein
VRGRRPHPGGIPRGPGDDHAPEPRSGRTDECSARRTPELIEVIMEGMSASIHDFILREFLPGEDPRELTDQTPLITGGILDSISMLKLVTFLEDRFGITIEAHEAGVVHLDTIEQIAALVAAKQHLT